MRQPELIASSFGVDVADFGAPLPFEGEDELSTLGHQELILLIEDDFVLRTALTELLRTEGYAVECAANGLEGMRRLSRSPKPSLILLDIMLPYMDGLQFRSAQLDSPTVADIPVVVISAIGIGRDGERLRFAATFSKPLDTDRLLKTVHRICAGTAS
jgi:CheY-like chemotaxis protein